MQSKTHIDTPKKHLSPYCSIKSLFVAVLYTRLIVSVLLLGIPAVADASALSVVSGWFGGKQVSVLVSSSANSQTLKLPQATLNSNPNSGRGGGEINIVGGTALLPESGPEGTLADLNDIKNNNSQISVYVVKKGDALSNIAKMFGVSVNTIVWANDINNGIITDGQRLIILPISGIQYKVIKGDTLKSIALKYKADSDEILQFNDLSENSKLAVGDTLIIPSIFDGETSVLDSGTTLKASSKAKTTSPLHGAGGPDYGDYYRMPVAGAYRVSQSLHGYNAVDLAGAEGTSVVAAASGEVIIARSGGWNGGYGNYVVIEHSNGSQTLYGHLEDIEIAEGFHVVRGQEIGHLGSTGKSTGPHVHFEVRGAKNPFAN